ncbi:MAG: energy-coupling factor ABC transporter ATP-binding protein [Clostridia bacterium]
MLSNSTPAVVAGSEVLPIHKRPVIEVKDMKFSYPDGTPALLGINLNVYEGEFIALLGQNGAGKTTFAKTLNGLLKPTEGDVLVNGVNTKEKGVVKKLVEQVGYVFQNPDHQLFNNEVRKEIAYAPENIGLSKEEVEKRVINAAEVAGIKRELFEMHPFFLQKGLRQRVSIASILALQPRVIIVDEPTTGQDFKQSLEVMNFLKMLNEEQGHTIIIITHEMDIISKYAKRAIALSMGRVILDGPTNEVFAQSEKLASTFVYPPECTQIAQALEEFGLNRDTISIKKLEQDFYHALSKG